MNQIKLGVNIDHVATLRQLRQTKFPDLRKAALLSMEGGADYITIHLREDRRHIQDDDLSLLVDEKIAPINLEMALTPEMEEIALSVSPESCCIVPEKREEVTTEGGLDLFSLAERVEKFKSRLDKKKIELALFLEPDAKLIDLANTLGVRVIELHTGNYCLKDGEERELELAKIRDAVHLGNSLGIKMNAGHGLDYENVIGISRLVGISELNIGHSIVCKAVEVGLYRAVSEMKYVINGDRS